MSSLAGMSGDGRYVAFVSTATNVVPGDTNGVADVFLFDGVTGALERVSVASGGGQADGASLATSSTAVSGDGRLVAFSSSATNLVPNDTNAATDMFVRDRTNGTTERVNLNADGSQQTTGTLAAGAAISSDGRYVGFATDGILVPPESGALDTDVFLRDRVAGVTERISSAGDGAEANDSSAGVALSPDARFVGFSSRATNLVPGDTNGITDGFLKDRSTGAVERVNLASDESQATGGNLAGSLDISISADGRYVSFISVAPNLVSGDTNASIDVFVRDRTNSTTDRVSVADGGAQLNTNSTRSSMSSDGRYIVFESLSSNAVPGDTNTHTDVFSRDRTSSTTRRVNLSFEGRQGNAESSTTNRVLVSGDGRYVAFNSAATNLVPRDTGGQTDVFVRDRLTPGFDSMYRTMNWNHDCSDGGLNCQTDDDLVELFAESTVPQPGVDHIEAIIESQFEPTNLGLEWVSEPVYTGDTETDVIYIYEDHPDPEPGDPAGSAWCDDAVGGTDLCDQHYVQFDDDQPETLMAQVICHETGHAVGLTHGQDAHPRQPDDDSALLGCMGTPVDGTEILGNHNIDMINATYPQ